MNALFLKAIPQHLIDAVTHPAGQVKNHTNARPVSWSGVWNNF